MKCRTIYLIVELLYLPDFVVFRQCIKATVVFKLMLGGLRNWQYLIINNIGSILSAENIEPKMQGR